MAMSTSDARQQFRNLQVAQPVRLRVNAIGAAPLPGLLPGNLISLHATATCLFPFLPPTGCFPQRPEA
jgi:hypothetical protein